MITQSSDTYPSLGFGGLNWTSVIQSNHWPFDKNRCNYERGIIIVKYDITKSIMKRTNLRTVASVEIMIVLSKLGYYGQFA